jgi:hypothetical protein
LNGHFSFLCDINGEVPNCSPCYFNPQKSPFLTADLEARPAPLPVMASGGDHDKHPCGGSPCHDGRQLLSHRAWIDASSSQASPWVRWGFTLCRCLPGLASCRDVGLCMLIGVGLCCCHTLVLRMNPKPPYVCPGCSNYTYDQQYGEQIQYLIKLKDIIFTK